MTTIIVGVASAGGALADDRAAVPDAPDYDRDGVADHLDRFPCAPDAVAEIHAPGEGLHGTLAFEDRWPEAGDFDFNDFVVSYHYLYRLDAQLGVTSMRVTLDVRAVGGTYDLGLGLHLPLPSDAVLRVQRRIGDGPVVLLEPAADAELTVDVVDSVRTLFGGRPGRINSENGAPHQVSNLVVLDVVLTRPVGMQTGGAPHDLFVFRAYDRGHEIHRPAYRGTTRMNTALFGTADDASTTGRAYVDLDGVPFAFAFPEVVAYPEEADEISALFPTLPEFVANEGQAFADFYIAQVDLTHAYAPAGAGASAPRMAPSAPDRACLPD